ncbi:hypothetical protein D4740_08415 [Actinomyces sp. 2119]|uniref:Uncharacterized protein n=1 Tax=Actinomyces lilanjuaniae TaxID=2321394 RepID=A0ABM6Z511_9ACTO|nr:hypothetical protein D5R93_09415 [Actinomyces lilanjuaniae]RJF41412.1 hypothetical protein D4740_08415 [Actinomyces sp. 2119]
MATNLLPVRTRPRDREDRSAPAAAAWQRPAGAHTTASQGTSPDRGQTRPASDSTRGGDTGRLWQNTDVRAVSPGSTTHEDVVVYQPCRPWYQLPPPAATSHCADHSPPGRRRSTHH